MSRLLGHRPSPAMVVAMLALFVSLAGTGYAAIRLPANGVGTKQIKSSAVVSTQIKNGSLHAHKDFGARLVHRGAAAKTPAPPGVVFGGRTAQGWPIAIEVSKDARQVVREDVALRTQCTSGTGTIQPDSYRRLPLSTTGSFSASFGPVTSDVGNGQKADFSGKMKGKLNPRRTSGTGTWSLKVVVHDATGAIVDTCDSGVVTWKVKQ
jgi:hypothetical protein